MCFYVLHNLNLYIRETKWWFTVCFVVCEGVEMLYKEGAAE